MLETTVSVPSVPCTAVEIQISGYVTDKATGQPLQGVPLHVFHADGWSACHDFADSDENGYFEMRQWGNINRVSQLTIEVEDTVANYRHFDTLSLPILYLSC